MLVYVRPLCAHSNAVGILIYYYCRLSQCIICMLWNEPGALRMHIRWLLLPLMVSRCPCCVLAAFMQNLMQTDARAGVMQKSISRRACVCSVSFALSVESRETWNCHVKLNKSFLYLEWIIYLHAVRRVQGALRAMKSRVVRTQPKFVKSRISRKSFIIELRGSIAEYV